jgi:hypothetical protein
MANMAFLLDMGLAEEGTHLSAKAAMPSLKERIERAPG